MLATKPETGADPDLLELADRYLAVMLAMTPPNVPRDRYMRAIKLALVAVSQEAIEDGTSTVEGEAGYYEGIAARIRLTTV